MDKLENTRSCVRCIRSMCRSFWPLILKQTVILTAMSNYFLSYICKLAAHDRRQTETLLAGVKHQSIHQYMEYIQYTYIIHIKHYFSQQRTI